MASVADLWWRCRRLNEASRRVRIIEEEYIAYEFFDVRDLRTRHTQRFLSPQTYQMV